MFKFELNQEIFYLRENRLHSAKVLSREYVDNVDENDLKSVWQQFGKGRVNYATCHGIILGHLAFGSKEELAEAIVNGTYNN